MKNGKCPECGLTLYTDHLEELHKIYKLGK